MQYKSAKGFGMSQTEPYLITGRRSDIQFYFCDPRSLWQCRANENTKNYLDSKCQKEHTYQFTASKN